MSKYIVILTGGKECEIAADDFELLPANKQLIFKGYGCELSADYFRDGIGYLKEADDEVDAPTLFDFIGV